MNKIYTLKNKWYFPVILFGIYFCFIHFFIYFTNFGDDAGFAKGYNDPTLPISLRKGLHGLSLIEAMKLITDKLETWSSRYLVEYTIALFYSVLNRFWFAILDVFILILFLYSFIKLIYENVKIENAYFLTGISLLFPIIIMSSAGWLVTTINFLWSASFALYSSLLLKNIILDKYISKYQLVFGILAFIYAVNAEQMSAVFTVITALLLFYCIYKKQNIKQISFMFIISAFSLLHHLLSPANANRAKLETIRFFPDYDMITFAEKIELGFMQIAANMFYAPNLIYLILCLLVFIIIYKKYNDFWVRFLSSVPLAVILIFGFFNKFISSIYNNFNLIPSLKGFAIGDKYTGIVSFDNFSAVTSYVPVMLAVISVLFLAAAIYYCLCFKSKLLSLFMSLIYLLGIGAGSIMGFSPTVYVSHYRTHTIVYLCLMVVIGFIYSKNEDTMDSKSKTVLKTVLLIAVILSLIIQSEKIMNIYVYHSK